ncbi:chloride channel protein, partial [Bosea sp. TAB14]|uniref:chloride channel protein n=1 Tax=Bosea sp. TAB14 TaxID=3237481 RepID=UPI003F902AFA
MRLLRRSRALVVTPRYWRQRLVFWLGALAIGLVSAGFARLADEAQQLFSEIAGRQDGLRLLPLLVTPLGFGLCAFIAARFVQGSQGSGIPQAIAARHLRDDAERSRFLSLRIAAGKIVMTIIGLLCGASIGREGPTVQVGASIMLQVARWGGMVQARGLILA